jgi:hypothetical protein
MNLSNLSNLRECNARPRVSGIQNHVNEPSSNANDAVANAAPNPFRCASDAMRSGARALPMRPMLNVKPAAAARTAVG